MFDTYREHFVMVRPCQWCGEPILDREITWGDYAYHCPCFREESEWLATGTTPRKKKEVPRA